MNTRNGLLTVAMSALAAGCAVTSPIQPARTSESAFAHAVYKGTTVQIRPASPGRQSYRVFIQGATGFVSMQSVRDDAEQRAKDFCAAMGSVFEALQETVANPPYIMGNFPRIEIVFDCVHPIPTMSIISGSPRIDQIRQLKKLLDDGAITQAEFESEKAKILNSPSQ
jgi:hypothetical protein